MATRKEWVPNGLRNAFTSMERVLVGNDSRRWETFERDSEQRTVRNNDPFQTVTCEKRVSETKRDKLETCVDGNAGCNLDRSLNNRRRL